MENLIKVEQTSQHLAIPYLILQTQGNLVIPENKKQQILNQRAKEEDVRKNFKWSYQEHGKYIHFLEMNKLKAKCKMVRKSNAFFREMENYIKTKTSIQCRSHHQKFQEKYKFPHRIITGQKKHIPPQIYSQILQEHAKSNYHPQIDHYTISTKTITPMTEGKEVACQTEICDLRLDYGLRSVYNQQHKMGSQMYYNYNPLYGMCHYPIPFLI